MSLNDYLNMEWLKAAYERVQPDSAPGIDGRNWADYGKDLEKNLQRLLNRVKSGSYVAPPVKRMHIPKGDGKETRPIGIGMPTIEDKVLQRAIAMLLEPIYEQDFKYFSYGFRPERSAHEALRCLWNHQPVVSEEPARTDTDASGSVGPKTQRTLWVLRHHRQLRSAGSVSG
ncbi:MAG TPA: reverse transcriptase domain-containing protein [Verrucomicrobiae bacterium]|nr:reverse transcriptase domain-containing protein [Verrucomicrobiae bacterium]